MTLPQPGKVQKFSTGITLNPENDVFLEALATTSSGSRFFYNGSQFGIFDYDTNTNRMEANIWNNDGSLASNFFFQDKYVLDAVYDVHDQVYYGVQWNNTPNFYGSGTSFGVYSEGGAESSTALLIDEFVEIKSWHSKTIQPLELETKIVYNPPNPITVNREVRKWTDFSERSYSGYPSGWETTSWGNEFLHYTSVLQTQSTDLLEIDEDNGRLVYFSNSGVGYLHFDCEVLGNFVAFVDLDVSAFEDDCVMSFRVLRRSDVSDTAPFNHMGSICYRGSDSDPRIQTWAVEYLNDTSGKAWGVSNLRINEVFLDSSASGAASISTGTSETFTVSVPDYRLNTQGPLAFGEFTTIEHVFPFDVKDSSDTSYGYGVLSSNTALDDIDVGSNPTYYAYGDINRSFSWVGSSGQVLGFDAVVGYSFDPDAGILTDFVVNDYVKSTSQDVRISMFKEASVPGIDNDKIRLAIKRIGSTIYFLKRDNTIAGGSYTEVSSFDSGYTGPVRFELFGDATQGTANPDITSQRVVVRDLFTSEATGEGSSGTAVWTHPVFSLKTYDLDGNPIQVSDVSDINGYAIKQLDIIGLGQDFSGKVNNYLNKTQIATNHGSASVSGEVYINVNTDFYKYLKSTLPIASIEDGSSASKVSPGALYGSPYYGTLMWNSYTEAGLIYLADNDADPGQGLYLNTIRHTTMSGSTPTKFAWITESDPNLVMYTVDVNQLSLLYGLDVSGNVYIYNLDEDSSAFCNVVSNKQIMGAATSATSLVTAQVLNIYGDPLEGKTVNFSVSSGDGSISPASDITDSVGEASTTYTVGSTVGNATIRATVTD